MDVRIEEFEIQGLYGSRDYLIKFEDNQVILVGENGSGKSTVVSILHYFLTGQWRKLLKFHFKTLSLTVNGIQHYVDRLDIASFEDSDDSSSKELHVLQRLNELGITPEDALSDFSSSIHRYLTDEFHISPSGTRRILKDLSNTQNELFNNMPKKLKELKNLQDQLDLNVLFLPTYRRIERDLKTIFPALEDDVRRFNKNFNRYSNHHKHLELVEFGMHDVRAMIDSTMKHLDAQFRVSLDTLTGGYLRVILRKEYEKADVSILKDIDATHLEEILQKIDESVLSEDDQRTLRETIRRFGDVEPSSAIDKLSAHIISELIILHKHQYEREEKVRAFASVCNKYIKGKQFEFDNNNFTLPIKPINNEFHVDDSGEDEIELSMLSSGEKQIVSLFSHLYLSDKSNYFIIIDEPELSLSVPWQKTFLPDMLASGRCSGLVAVTHSPFIYSNDLKDKAHSIQEFLRIEL